jgi:3'-phosphoadenosine 5'-phosphosulfate sulfotransferase (PAPS reductase)/FAD synthetase
MDLEGLSVRCPRCGQIGFPFPRWIKGPKIKPLYILHKNGDDVAEACLLKKEEAELLRGEVYLEAEDIKTLFRNAKAFVLFSGGRDSLCTLDYSNRIALELGERVTALHIDTTVGFPEVTRYVKKVCKKLEIDLEIVKPQTDFFTLAKEWGIPTHCSRWCCRELKIRPVADFLALQKAAIIVVDGIRAVESSIRSKYMPLWYHPSFNCLSISPIFGWSDKQVRSYVEKRKLPKSPSFSLGSSCECWCGAYKTKRDFEELYRLHPEIYKKLEEVERQNKHGFTFIYEHGERISLEDLRRQVEKRKRKQSTFN